jgi:hypothetical protein
MNEDQLILAIRERAVDPTRRTDSAERGAPDLAAAATDEQVARAEQALGCTLHPFHRRLLEEIGNGGFGPGDGLIGLPGGRTDDEGRSVVELRHQLFADAEGAGVPFQVVPLCDWGDGVWSCVDEDKGTVLTLDESGLFDTGTTLENWMKAWVLEENIWEKMFLFEERTAINPFTKKPMSLRAITQTLGTQYAGRTRRE